MIRPASFALMTALALGTPAIASAATERPVAAQVATTPSAPAPAAAADASGYAQREQQDKQVLNYEGGSVVVIGISGGALVVLLLILLLI
jgi:hypothetical protein